MAGTFVGVNGGSGGGAGGGPSVLRQAMESLLRAQADAELAVEEAARLAEQSAVQVAEVARRGRHPAARQAADQVAATAPALAADVAPVAATTTTAIAEEVHALLGLLAPGHQQPTPLPPLDPVPLATPGRPIDAAFPTGFARDYVQAVLRDLPHGRATSKTDAAGHPDAVQTDIDAARQRIVDAVAPEHQARVRAWLEHPDCHAVEIHGPQVSDRELELRVGWTRPPDRGTDGSDSWRVRDDGKVVSKHGVGTEATRFTTPESFARPLDAVLAVADHYPGGPDRLLNDHSIAGRTAVFVSTRQAELTDSDTSGYRGAGTGTKEAAKDWRRMRTDAMKAEMECLPPVRTVAYDPTADGQESGVVVVFVKDDGGVWFIKTCYPAAEPGPDSKRLEDVT